MKKTVVVILSTLLILAAVGIHNVSGLAEGSAIIKADIISASSDEDVSITVSIESELLMNGLEFDIEYNPGLMYSGAYASGDLVASSDQVLFECNVTGENKLSVSVAFYGDAMLANGTVVTIGLHTGELLTPGQMLDININVNEFYVISSENQLVTIDLPYSIINGGIIIEKNDTCTVSFDSDGGSEVPSQSVSMGNPAVNPDNPIKNGYTFVGWTLDGNAYDFATPVYSDITLKAMWTEGEAIPYITWEDGVYIYSTVALSEIAELTGDETTLSDGWYIGSEELEFASRLVIDGDVMLLLKDGCIMDAVKGITVSEGNTLKVYAQSFGNSAGALNASGASSTSGIGGGKTKNDRDSGTIIIYGGIVTAEGGNNAAGIGGGKLGEGGEITIYGGTITALGGGSAAGIGGGSDSAGGTISILGGNVTVTADNDECYGIGNGLWDPDEVDEPECSIILSWTSENDYIEIDSYSATSIVIEKPFMVNGTNQRVSVEADNFVGNRIIPAKAPRVYGEHLEIRNRIPEDGKSDLRFVFKVVFNDSYIKYNGALVGPAQNGYQIKKIEVTLQAEGGENVGMVNVRNLWDMQSEAETPNFLFTVVVSAIPEANFGNVIHAVPEITYQCGSYTNVSTCSFTGSVEDVTISN